MLSGEPFLQDPSYVKLYLNIREGTFVRNNYSPENSPRNHFKRKSISKRRKIHLNQISIVLLRVPNVNPGAYWPFFLGPQPENRGPLERRCLFNGNPPFCGGLCWFDLLGQWLNFKLFGITYLIGKISRLNFFFQGPGRLSEFRECIVLPRYCYDLVKSGLPTSLFPRKAAMNRARIPQVSEVVV